MSFYKIVNGSYPTGDQWMANVLESVRLGSLNLIRELIDREVDFSADGTDFYGEAYTDSDGRLNSVDTSNTTATFDTDKYKTLTKDVYVVVEATSLTTTDFEINDCEIKNVDDGKWLLYCTTGTDAVKRAQIYKTLFYGTDGSDARASSTYITGITALKTSVSRDVGKKAQYLEGTYIRDSNGSDQYIINGSFASTTGNLSVSSWARLQGPCPPSSINDYIGTDLESEEQDNPADCGLYTFYYSNYNDSISFRLPKGNTVCSKNHTDTCTINAVTEKVLVLTSSTITWSVNGSSTENPIINSDIDFNIDNGIPLFTAAVNKNFNGIIYHTIPSGTFPANTSSAYLKAMYADWEDGCSTQFKLVNNFDEFNNNSYIEITANLLNNPEELNINNCIIRKVDNNKWVLFSKDSDDEIARAKLYETLFYGGASAKINNFNDITSISTSINRDVGKRVSYTSSNANDYVDVSSTGTFSDTTDNNDCSAWSNLHNANSYSDTYFQFPTGTTVNSNTSYSSYHIGTDRSSDENDNPASCKLVYNGSGSSGSSSMKIIALHKGTLSWSDSSQFISTSIVDFYSDYNIPLFSSVSNTNYVTEDSGWLTEGELNTFTAFTIEPTTCIVKLIPATGGTACYPAIKGIAYRGAD